MKRRTHKLTAKEAEVASGRIDLACSECHRMVYDVMGYVRAVTCWRCVAQMIDPPVVVDKKPLEKRPRGWQKKKEYISPSGLVYHSGVLVDTSHTVATKVSAKITSAGMKQCK
jgi:hypothetical protein